MVVCKQLMLSQITGIKRIIGLNELKNNQAFSILSKPDTDLTI